MGFAVKNIGPKITYEEEPDPLPAAFVLGLAYAWNYRPGHKLNFMLDFVKPLELDIKGHVGAEYWYHKVIALRAGYKYGYDLFGLTCGCGFAWKFMQVDYAMALMGDLGTNHLVSMTFGF